MAERVPPPPTVPDSPVGDDPFATPHIQDQPISPGKTPSDHLLLSSETYIVQVPKDQIYRVPPPENAVIADRHRNTVQTKTRSPRCSRCFIVAVFLIVFVVVIASCVLVAGLLSGFFSPENPDFSVRRVIVEKQKNSRLNFDVDLQATNPNTKVGISYKAGGSVTLRLKSKKVVAEGKFPTFDQRHKNSTNLEVFLRGSNVVLPKEMQKSLKAKVHLSLTLKIDVSVAARLWVFEKGSKKLEVTCNFMVDSLAKSCRILSQTCTPENEK